MEYAPLPARNGLSRSVCEVVHSLGGATAKEVKTYLPAADHGNASLERVKKSLTNAVYRGYLIVDNSAKPSKYRRAPAEYYQARRKKAKAIYRRRSAKKQAKKTTPLKKEATVHTEPAQSNGIAQSAGIKALAGVVLLLSVVLGLAAINLIVMLAKAVM